MRNRKGNRYSRLTEYLQTLDISRWSASFAQIEKILGFDLPYSASEYPAWWANQSEGGPTQSQAWQKVGWRTEGLDLANRRVTFVKERDVVPAENTYNTNERSVVGENSTQGISIQEAKIGLAKTFGVSVEAIEITIKL